MSVLRVYLDNTLREQIDLVPGKLSIGRFGDNDIVLNESGVSGYHATIEYDGHDCFVIDNESTNGVFVNNQRVTHHQLKYWEEIQIYNYVLRFMVRSGLGEMRNIADHEEMSLESDKTRFVKVGSNKDLQDLRKRKRIACLIHERKDGAHEVYKIDEAGLSIGRHRDCNVHTTGWFSPRVAARVECRLGSYYINPIARGKIKINGERIRYSQKLNDGDHLSVKKTYLTFSIKHQ
ncbi:MAG: FHA domain-containing protein [Sedimenticola sp.]